MSQHQLDDNLGVFVILNGPTIDKIVASLRASITGRRKQNVTFSVMPGFLFDEEGRRVVEPILQDPIKLVTSVNGIQQEMGKAGLLPDCVNLTVRVEQRVGSIKPLPHFRNLAIRQVLAVGAHLHLSYNVETRMGGVALNNQRSLVTSKDYWQNRIADGWLIAGESIKDDHEDTEDEYNGIELPSTIQ